MSESSSNKLSPKEIVYGAFYGLTILLAIVGSGRTGFRGINSHTPPISFVVELICLPTGFVLWLIDARFYKRTLVHKIGLAANLLIMLITLAVAVFDL